MKNSKKKYIDSSTTYLPDTSENSKLNQKLNDFTTFINTVDDPPISKTVAAERIASAGQGYIYILGLLLSIHIYLNFNLVA